MGGKPKVFQRDAGRFDDGPTQAVFLEFLGDGKERAVAPTYASSFSQRVLQGVAAFSNSVESVSRRLLSSNSGPVSACGPTVRDSRDSAVVNQSRELVTKPVREGCLFNKIDPGRSVENTLVDVVSNAVRLFSQDRIDGSGSIRA